MTTPSLDPCTFVIFGGTGDLARRKLLPALARLRGHAQPESLHVVGVARSSMTDAEYRQFVDEALQQAGLSAEERAEFCGSCLHFLSLGAEERADFERLHRDIEAIEKTHHLPGNRVLYLALPPRAFAPTVEHLAAVGLDGGPGWTRLVIEKPFGTDLASAKALNAQIHARFAEEQVYRIDHYLGKDTVQNLLVLRFANPIFEAIWNRRHIHSVQITVAENLGIGKRAGYYDRAGALRDMVQNHLMQLLALTAMEVPATYSAQEVRFEKLKVLRSITPFSPEQAVLGQYGVGELEGRPVPGYLQEAGVPPESRTETFAALRVSIDNWRWQGVPFYLRTGKRLPRRCTFIAVRFLPAPVRLFESMGQCPNNANLLVLSLQPNEGFAQYVEVKEPGSPFRTQRIPLDFSYSERFHHVPEAYETLLMDVIEGDQTLFVHGDEVERSWELVQPLLEHPPATRLYPAGGWGPEEARAMRVDDPLLWSAP